MHSALDLYAISVVALLGVVVRPWRSPEVAWAVTGAGLLVATALVPPAAALAAVGKGVDVYLFLVGMMLLSAIAEREGVFDHLASVCIASAHGSATRLFTLVYAAGTLVTVFMSNDATAVVLTPAVLAVSRKAAVKSALPYLLVCAFIANAASFVLPISNPANLVVFADKLPPLDAWFGRFLLPSVLSIGVTYGALRWLARRELAGAIRSDVTAQRLAAPGRLAAAGIGLVAVVLLVASALDTPLGLPTLVAAIVAWLAVALHKRESPLPVLRDISWSVVPLVAGLFVIVEGLQRAGLLAALSELLRSALAASPHGGAIAAGAIVGFACNLMNNLPAGLIAGSVVNAAGAQPLLQGAVAIGIDLGPNLSVTGSLATILWLTALRKQGEHVSAWAFLKFGAVVMPLALGAALAGLWLQAVIVG